MTSAIGLDPLKAEKLAERLNVLLADYSLFYQNTRGLHWNIKGGNFFELHLKFEELYNDLLLKVDEVAERILTLGHTPQHTYSSYTQVAGIKESPMIADGLEAVEHVLASLKTLIILQRDILNMADEAGDEGTNALMSDYIREQEKLVWMYSSFLNR